MKIFKSFFLLTTILSSSKSFGSGKELDIYPSSEERQVIAKSFLNPETELQTTLKKAPPSVVSFFDIMEALNSETLYPPQLKVIQGRFYDYLRSSPFHSDHNQFTKTKFNLLIKGISVSTAETREKILDFFISCLLDSDQPRDIFFLVKLLHMWPYQTELQNKINQPQLRENLGRALEASYLVVLFPNSENHDVKTQAISDLNKYKKKGTILAALLSQDEELNSAAQKIITARYYESFSELQTYLPFLMESDLESVQKCGYDWGEKWIKVDKSG